MGMSLVPEGDMDNFGMLFFLCGGEVLIGDIRF
jgi:hypothetical protein